jgi:hypothetical protein
MDEKTTHMVFATAALAAVAAVLAGPATTQQGLDMAIKTAIASRASEAKQLGMQTIPYLSQGVGVDASQFAGAGPRQLDGVHGALVLNAKQGGATTPLPHGIQVVLSPPSESQSLGLTGDSALGRVVAHEPEGLTGDSALTRVPEAAPAPTVSGGEDTDWTSFGAGAGMVALIAAGLVGILLTARRRHTIGLP